MRPSDERRDAQADYTQGYTDGANGAPAMAGASADYTQGHTDGKEDFRKGSSWDEYFAAIEKRKGRNLSEIERAVQRGLVCAWRAL